jgi:hypothetical protein
MRSGAAKVRRLAGEEIDDPGAQFVTDSYLARRAERLGELAMKVEARRNSVCGQCATAGEEDVSGTA